MPSPSWSPPSHCHQVSPALPSPHAAFAQASVTSLLGLATPAPRPLPGDQRECRSCTWKILVLCVGPSVLHPFSVCRPSSLDPHASHLLLTLHRLSQHSPRAGRSELLQGHSSSFLISPTQACTTFPSDVLELCVLLMRTSGDGITLLCEH